MIWKIGVLLLVLWVKNRKNSEKEIANFNRAQKNSYSELISSSARRTENSAERTLPTSCVIVGLDVCRRVSDRSSAWHTKNSVRRTKIGFSSKLVSKAVELISGSSAERTNSSASRTDVGLGPNDCSLCSFAPRLARLAPESFLYL